MSEKPHTDANHTEEPNSDRTESDAIDSDVNGELDFDLNRRSFLGSIDAGCQEAQ